MTNDLDTESRLRGYLNTRAEAYPDSAVPPGLPTEQGVRRGRWPVLLAAAAIVAVLAVTVTTVRLLDGGQPPAATGSALAVPYVLVSRDAATLHDGDTTVKLADRVSHEIIGRVADGWVVRKLVERPPLPGRFPTAVDQVGLVDRSGRFTPVGPTDAMAAVLAPDRTKVVLVYRTTGDNARMAVFDLGSKKQVAAIPVHAAVAPVSWNRHGIWFFQHSMPHPVGVFVWRPGEPQPQQIAGVMIDGPPTAASTTERMIVQSAQAGSWCLRVMEPRATTPTSLTTVREYCNAGVHPYPVLSADGRFMVLPSYGLAIEVDTGRELPIEMPPGERSVPDGIAETATSFLVVTQQPDANDPTPTPVKSGDTEVLSRPIPESLVSRCEIASGACTPALRVPGGTTIQIGKP